MAGSSGKDQLLPSGEWLVDILEKHNQQTSSSKPEIGKVPRTLREIKSNENCFDPSVVALGPYHHDDERLKPMESYKKEAACWFVKLLACPSTADNVCSSRVVREIYDKFVTEATTISLKEPVSTAQNNQTQASVNSASAKKNLKEWYVADESTEKFNDEEFNRMMFLDGCFILCFIDLVVNNGKGMTITHLNQAIIVMDMFLLENQIPYVVLEALMKLMDEERQKKEPRSPVCTQQGAPRGGPEEKKMPRPRGPEEKKMPREEKKMPRPGGPEEKKMPRPGGLEEKKMPREEKKMPRPRGPEEMKMPRPSSAPPRGAPCLVQTGLPCLDQTGNPLSGKKIDIDGFIQLWFLHGDASTRSSSSLVPPCLGPSICLTKEKRDEKAGDDKADGTNSERILHLLDLLRSKLIGAPPKLSDPGFQDYYFRSIMELKAAGIKIHRSRSRDLTEIKFKPGLIYGELFLPQMSIDDATKTWLLNVIAYEMCPQGPFSSDATITSYICFMDSLIDQADDVKELRSKDILLNSLGSDEEVAKLFNEVANNLVPNDRVYGKTMEAIQSHCKSRCKVWFAEMLYAHFSSPWTVISLIAAIFLLFLTVVQTVYTVWN